MAETEGAARLVGDEDTLLHRLPERVAQIALRQLHSCLEQRVADLTSGCRRQAQHALCRAIEAGDSLQEEVAHGMGELPTIVARNGEQLLGEEGVSLRAGHDRVRYGRRQGSVGVGREERCELVASERTEFENERRAGAPDSVRKPSHALRRGGVVRAVGRKQENRNRPVVEVVRQEDNKIERRDIGPVQILEHEQHGCRNGALAEERERLFEHL